MPQRAPGTSPDFPILGTGEYDWKGYDPQTQQLIKGVIFLIFVALTIDRKALKVIK